MDCHQTECDVFKLTLCQNIYTPRKNRIETLLGGILYERLNNVQENLIGGWGKGGSVPRETFSRNVLISQSSVGLFAK